MVAMSQDEAALPRTSPTAEVLLPDPRSTVIVMHASVGSGHRSAANAVAQALELLRESDDASLRQDVAVPPDLEVEVLDVLSFGRIVFDGDKAASMFTGATRPVYDLT